MNREKVKAIVTIIAAGIAFINTILTAKGINPIPFSEEAVYEWVSVGVNAVLIIYAWWKNQNVTDEAQIGQLVIDDLKSKRHIEDLSTAGDDDDE